MMSLSPTSDLATTVHWAAGTSCKNLYPALHGNVNADIAIVGSGFLGLSAALTLTMAGRDVVILEAAEPGAGASGRNAAQILPGWAKRLPADALRLFGAKDGAVMNRMAADAPRDLFDLIRVHNIPCEAKQTGHLSIVCSEKALQKGVAMTAAWAAEGAPASMFSAHDIRDHLNVAHTAGGWVFHHGGTLNPLALARGLAAVTTRHGARIYAGTPVTGITQGHQTWKLSTPQGTVHARRVIIAVNAYGKNLWPGLDRAGYPLPCVMLASRPLADRSAFRWQGPWGFADDKTVFGGVLDASHVLLSSVLPCAGYTSPDRLGMVASRKFSKHFPGLERITWEKFWIGNFMLTPDGFPKIINPAPGLYAGFGCNGLGIAMTHALGKSIAQRILQSAAEDTLYPFSPLEKAPLRRALPWAVHNVLLPLARTAGG